MKRFFDVVFSGAALIFVFPLFPILGLLIRLDSRGPVFFRQQRVGLNGVPFMIYKFRTMEAGDAVHSGPKITRLGRLLRNTSLDEIPQFINVLKGEMSVVGPRPLFLDEVATLSAQLPEFPKRHQVKPGITGLVQVSDMRSKVSTLEEQRQRLALDLGYVAAHSFAQDMIIVLRTVWTVIARYNVSVRTYPESKQ